MQIFTKKHIDMTLPIPAVPRVICIYQKSDKLYFVNDDR